MKLLRKIDEFFSQRKSSEKYLIYATIFIGIVLLSYQYLFPMTEKMMKTALAQKNSIEAKINMDKAYLRGITVNGDELFYIKQFSLQIGKLKGRLTEIIDKKDYLNQKIKELSYLLYNEKKWAEFLNSLTQKAAKNGVQIDYILNNFLDVTKNFGHVLEVEIGCNGDYKNLISYINSIEQSDLVVDVYEIDMDGGEPIKTILKVSVWGINF
ncbi:type 4a pilus biogenesis protein PilO [Nitratiruptor sp. YY09-18]|uniref:type 4a pilus biogenesis protein PilO n=1 Tax=Nitratiruptor sp. YY09-18 TaxID=2724901 RepID=UPI0019168BCF|nr:type 4a pilus biogenesis protein PilO [Nitratiruptor sp. YY09-18]BCD68074.1 hypothetical protein NitYY0918_C0985 [Nitratiruptor sp. YY09-18]